MAETVIAVIDVGLQLFAIVKQLPKDIAKQLLKDIATWKLNKKILPEKLQSFRAILELVFDRLQNFRELLENVKGVPNNQFNHYDTVIKVENCLVELNIISTIVVNLEER